MKLYYDIHIHSCLSPCADDEMTPNNIVNMAALMELDVIAVSDHNSVLNLPAVMELASQYDMLIVPAIEVTTSEEVHVLCLFYTLADSLRFGEMLYEKLTYIKNQADVFGNQLVMDKDDTVIKTEDKLLINATDLSIDKLLKIITDYNGVAIPAHIDKTSYSIISNLGFIPDEYNLKCVEVKRPPYAPSTGYNVITNSDAHYLESINERVNFIECEEKSVKCFIDTLIKQ